MRMGTVLGLVTALAATAAAAVILGKNLPEEEIVPEDPMPEVDPDKMVAYPLKNKYVDYSKGENSPNWLFELETPNGIKEIPVTEAHYETYYIGDEVICLETEKGPEVV